MVRDNDWLSVHIFYHANLDPLLVRLVAPLVDELAAAGLGTDYFFLRYWDGGNHLRLRLLVDERHQRTVRQRVRERCQAFLREHPSAAGTSLVEYQQQAAQLAARERVRDYHRRPYPNNSLAFVPYRREHARYGNGASIASVERHFGESSRLALRIIAAGALPAARSTAALSLLLLSWLVCGWQPNPGADPGTVAALPADAEHRYERQAPALTAIAARMSALAATGGDVRGGGVLAHWTRSVARLRDELGGGRPATAVIDACAHLVCNRLGLAGTEETYLRYLAVRALATVVVNKEGNHVVA